MESEAQLVRVWFHLESVEQEPLFRLSFAASTALQYVATVPVRTCMIWGERRRGGRRGGRRGEYLRGREEGRKERGIFERKGGEEEGEGNI